MYFFLTKKLKLWAVSFGKGIFCLFFILSSFSAFSKNFVAKSRIAVITLLYFKRK